MILYNMYTHTHNKGKEAILGNLRTFTEKKAHIEKKAPTFFKQKQSARKKKDIPKCTNNNGRRATLQKKVTTETWKRDDKYENGTGEQDPRG